MQDTFEVQTLKDGRWLIEQRCRNEEEAIAEAHELFATRAFRSVKVIKEVYDPSAKLYRETIILQLPSGNANAQNGSVNGSARPTAQRKTPAPAQASSGRPKPAAKKRSILDFFRE